MEMRGSYIAVGIIASTFIDNRVQVPQNHDLHVLQVLECGESMEELSA